MIRLRASAFILAVVAAMILVAGACGDDDGSNDRGLYGEVALSDADTLLTITFAPGDVLAGAPSSIASGDFNGDGAVDLLLGAPIADGPDDARPDAGEAYVLLGPRSSDLDLSSDSADAVIYGALSGDNLGMGVASGDLNDDGIDDIVLGAPNSNGINNVRSDMGEAYVIFGHSELPAEVDLAAGEQGFGLVPAEGFSHLGVSFGIGDVNGDGADDLVVGAPYAGRPPGSAVGSPRTTWGEVYVVYGGPGFGGKSTVADDDQDVVIAGLSEYDQFGGAVKVADANGDGTLDIIAGASGYDGPQGDRDGAGGVFVFYGGPDFPPRLTLDDADATIVGNDSNDQFGASLTVADLDGDGRFEAVVGVPSAAGPANDRYAAGEVAVIRLQDVSGSSDADTSTRIFAPTPGEFTPAGLAAQEGAIAIGSAMRGSAGASGGGYVYIADAPEGDLDLAADPDARMIRGDEAGIGIGTALAFADVDGDGADDLLIQAGGAPNPMGVDRSYKARIFVIRLG